LSSGEAFVAMDRLLDEAREGPLFLKQPELAQVVVKAIRYNAREMDHYELHAFVVMPNHVHLLLTPRVSLPKLTKSLKGIAGKRANAMLGFHGIPFWKSKAMTISCAINGNSTGSADTSRTIPCGRDWLPIRVITAGPALGRPGGPPHCFHLMESGSSLAGIVIP
jgi:hypothetical protein